MADRDPRGYRYSVHTIKTARKSAPTSSGINARRLALIIAERDQQEREQHEEQQEEEKAATNQCGNPFCKHILTNRYARFCEDKAMCQRYRALKLQCLANAQAAEDEEDTRPLSYIVKKKKKKEEEGFAIPKRKVGVEKRRRQGNDESSSSSSSPRQREKLSLKKHKKKEDEKEEKRQKTREEEKEEKRQKKKVVTSQEAAENNSTPSVQEVKKRKELRRATSSEVEKGTAGGKKRRLNRQVSADDVLSRSASSSSAKAGAVADTSWKIPRARPIQAKTAAQAIRSMNVEPVPLGTASQTNFTGGGRYVQNGNRSAAQLKQSAELRARPPKKTKFTSPIVAGPVTTVATRPPFAPPLTASSRPIQTPHPTVPTPPLPQIQPPLPHVQPPLPPLPPHAPSLVPSVPRPGVPVRAVTPSSSPVKAPAVPSQVNSSRTGTSASEVTRTRISTADYLKNRKGERRDQPSRSSSLERSNSRTDDQSSVYRPTPSAVIYPPRPSDVHSASLPASLEFRPRDSRLPIDPHRQYPDAEAQFRQQRFSDNTGSRPEYRDRLEGRGEPLGNDMYANGRWEGRSFPPSWDRYSSRQQEKTYFGSSSNGSYDYGADTHFSPDISTTEPPYRRENVRENPPPPQRAPSPRQSDTVRVNMDQKNSDTAGELDEETPTFSYHESFLPRLLSIFIYKLPRSLEAVFNVTKKPRKMNWYVKYIERIERLCEPYDLRVKFSGLKAVVTVRDREWLTLQGQSTVTLHQDVIKSLRAEAMTWLQFYEEMKKALSHYQSMHGNQTSESFTFLRAWNDLKTQGNNISLLRQANYFCGARLHHWNFVVGKVEIGSGSHEEKREAFRLATVSALDFLLRIGGERRLKPEVRRERVSETSRFSARGRRRSSSRESSASIIRTLRADDRADGASAAPSSPAGPTRSAEPLPSARQPSSLNASSTDPIPANEATRAELQHSTREPQSSVEPSSSPVTVDHTEMPDVAIIPTTGSNSSNEPAEAAEQSDGGEEMSISDASEVGALTPAGSPRVSMAVSDNNPAGATHTAALMATATAASSAINPVVTDSSIRNTVPQVKPVTTGAAIAGGSATAKNPSGLQTTGIAKAPIPSRRCMMCEMIRMRKPDGERCLRCQQKDEPSNGVLGS